MPPALVAETGPFPPTDNRDAFHINMIGSSANLFESLGARAAVGRGPRPEDGGQGHPTTIVLSDGVWRHLGPNPEISALAFELVLTRIPWSRNIQKHHGQLLDGLDCHGQER
jgi:hypothetical protein